MMDKFHIPISHEQARETLAKVPQEFRQIVAVTGAILAGSEEYVCPFCERRVSLEQEADHRGECEKHSAKS
jgi:hypothetical protein